MTYCLTGFWGFGVLGFWDSGFIVEVSASESSDSGFIVEVSASGFSDSGFIVGVFGLRLQCLGLPT